MSANEHTAAMQAVILCARILAQHDIPNMLRAGSTALDVGYFLNPTLWIQKNKALEEDMASMRAALPLHELGKKLEALAAAQLEAMHAAAEKTTEQEAQA